MSALAKWLRENAGRVAWTQPKPAPTPVPKPPKTAVEAKTFLQKHVQTQQTVFKKLAELLDAFGEKQAEENLDVKELASLPDIQNLDFKNAFTGTRTQATDEVRQNVLNELARELKVEAKQSSVQTLETLAAAVRQNVLNELARKLNINDDAKQSSVQTLESLAAAVRQKAVNDVAAKLNVNPVNSEEQLVDAINKKKTEASNDRLREFMGELGVTVDAGADADAKASITDTLSVETLVARVSQAIASTQKGMSGELARALQQRDSSRDQALIENITAYGDWFQELANAERNAPNSPEIQENVPEFDPEPNGLDSQLVDALSHWTEMAVKCATSEMQAEFSYSEIIATMLETVQTHVRGIVTKENAAVKTQAVAPWQAAMVDASNAITIRSTDGKQKLIPTDHTGIYVLRDLIGAYHAMCVQVLSASSLDSKTFSWVDMAAANKPSKIEFATHLQNKWYNWPNVLSAHRLNGLREVMTSWINDDKPKAQTSPPTPFPNTLQMDKKAIDEELAAWKQRVNEKAWKQAHVLFSPLENKSFHEAARALVNMVADSNESIALPSFVHADENKLLVKWTNIWSTALLYQLAARLFAMEFQIAKDIQDWKQIATYGDDKKGMEPNDAVRTVLQSSYSSVLADIVTCRMQFSGLADHVRNWFRRASLTDAWQTESMTGFSLLKNAMLPSVW
jgi:hypothetical protein